MAKYKTFDEYVKGEKIVRYTKWFKMCWDFATESAEENGSSHNTGSPKLPLLEDVLDEIFGNREACGQGAEYVKQTFCIIERQLRAGA